MRNSELLIKTTAAGIRIPAPLLTLLVSALSMLPKGGREFREVSLVLSPGEVKTESGAEGEKKELERKEIVCYWTCYL